MHCRGVGGSVLIMETKIRATAPVRLATFALTAFFAAACGSGGSTTGNGGEDPQQDDPGFNGSAGSVGVCTPAAVIHSGTLLGGALAEECSGGHFGGRARVVQATVLNTISASLIDTGELPAEGGSLGAKLLSVSVPDLLSAEVASANVDGEGEAAEADATVAKLNETVLGIGISADVIEANANAKCAPGGVESSGNSLVANLRVGGLTVDVTGDPNQTIEVRGILRIVINEQLKWPDGMRVRALHVTALSDVNGGVDVILSSADARVACDGAPTCGGGTGQPGGPGGGGTGGTGGSGGGSGGTGGSGGSGGGTGGSGGGTGGSGGSGGPGGSGSGGPGGSGGGADQGNPSFPIGGGTTGEACDAAHACAAGYACMPETH